MASFNSHTQIGLDVTAKNSVLKNQDLMAITFSYLQGNNACLLNAALTCKDLLDVALHKLWEEMNNLVPVLNLLPALRLENHAYVCANVLVFLYDLAYFTFRSLVGMFLRQIGIDCSITLEMSRISA